MHRSKAISFLGTNKKKKNTITNKIQTDRILKILFNNNPNIQFIVNNNKEIVKVNTKLVDSEKTSTQSTFTPCRYINCQFNYTDQKTISNSKNCKSCIINTTLNNCFKEPEAKISQEGKIQVKDNTEESIKRINVTCERFYVMGKPLALLTVENLSIEPGNEKSIALFRNTQQEDQEIANNGYWKYSIESGKLEWNDETFQIFEKSRIDFTPTYEGFLEAIHPDDRTAYDLAFKNAILKKKDFRINYRITTHEGQFKHIQEHVIVKSSPSKDSIELIGTIHVTNDLNPVVEKINSSKNLYKQIFWKSVLPMFLLENNKLVECNQAMLNKLEFLKKEELLFSTPWDFSPIKQPDGKPSKDKAIQLISTANQNGSHNFEWMHTTATGAKLWLRITLVKISHEQKDVFCVTFQDIQ